MSKYNRSEIFKTAWTTFKNVQNSQIRKIKPYCSDETELMELVRENMKPFSYYLKESWSKAKWDAKVKAAEPITTGWVQASELKVGDVVEIEYGLGVGFTAKLEIASISKASGNTAWEIAIRYAEGIKNFPGADIVNCLKPNDLVRRVAA